jgi:hypothetical protein
MENERYFEGELTYIGEPKEVAKNLWSVGLKVDADESYHNIVEFGLDKVKAILGTAKIGDKVSLREDKIKNYWNVKAVKFIEQVNAEKQGMKGISSYEVTPDLEAKLADIYSLVEKYGQASIEQNAGMQVQLDSIVTLLMKIAKNANIELDTFKKANEA